MHVIIPLALLVVARERCRLSENVTRILATAPWARSPSLSTFAVTVTIPPRLDAFGVTVTVIFRESRSIVEGGEGSALVCCRQRKGMHNTTATRNIPWADASALVNVATV